MVTTSSCVSASRGAGWPRPASSARLVGVGRRAAALVDAQQRRDAALALQGLGRLGEFDVVDQQLGRAVLEDVVQLGHGQPPVQQHGDGAAAAAGELQVEVFDPVVSQQGHAVAAADAQRAQVHRQRVGARIEFAVAQAARRRHLAHRFLAGAVGAVVGDPVVGRHRAMPARPRAAQGGDRGGVDFEIVGRAGRRAAVHRHSSRGASVGLPGRAVALPMHCAGSAWRRWSRRQESNLYLPLRRRPFYPLNYGERGRDSGMCCPRQINSSANSRSARSSSIRPIARGW